MAHPLRRNRSHIAPSYNLGVGDHYNLNPAAVRERSYERTGLLCAESRSIPQIPPLSSNSIDTSRDSAGILWNTGTRCNHRRGRGCSRSQHPGSAPPRQQGADRNRDTIAGFACIRFVRHFHSTRVKGPRLCVPESVLGTSRDGTGLLPCWRRSAAGIIGAILLLRPRFFV